MLDQEKDKLRMTLSPDGECLWNDRLFRITTDNGGELEDMKKKLDVLESYLLLLTRRMIKTKTITIDEVIAMVNIAQLA